MVDLNLRYAVITRIPRYPDEVVGEHGYRNMYDDLIYYDDENLVLTEGDHLEEIEHSKIFRIKRQTFRLGEVIPIDEYGREFGGDGRKPSKWVVDFEVYDSVIDAILRGEEAQVWYQKSPGGTIPYSYVNNLPVENHKALTHLLVNIYG